MTRGEGAVSFTYNASQLATNTTYQARLVLQDTVDDGHLLEDEEIAWILTQEANVWRAAATLAEMAAAKLGQASSRTVGDLSITYGAAEYRELAKVWRAKGSLHQQPFCGGISHLDKRASWEALDRVRPAFHDGMMSDPETRHASQDEETWPC